MDKQDIIRMAREAGLEDEVLVPWAYEINMFAALVAAAKDAEHKEAMRWDIHSCGPTCKRYACVATREAVAAEREACAKVAEHTFVHEVHNYPEAIAAAIRARKG